MNQIVPTFLIQRAIALGVSGNSQGVLRSNTGMTRAWPGTLQIVISVGVVEQAGNTFVIG